MQKLKPLILFFLGFTFLASGIAKLISIELFELFLYSFKIISFNLAAFAARFFIGVELIIGLSFLLRFKIKAVSVFTLVLLFFFTIFILYLEFSNSKEDCHCFGSLLQLSNTWSIIKNVVMAGLTTLLLKNDFPELKSYRKPIFAGVVVVGFGIAFAIHPPDFIYKKNPKGVQYCESCFESLMDKQGLNNRKLVICFLSPQCKYCKLAAKKISTISQISDNQMDIIYIFWDNKKNIKEFISQTNSEPIQQRFIGTLEFIALTKGEMPLIILSNNGRVEQVFRYDDMDEKEIVQFLKK